MEHKICKKCIMDTSDSDITFNENGICNHCIEFENSTAKLWHPNEYGLKLLNEIFHKVKTEGKGKEYDCILGLSGGVDSAYLALKIKEYGLRPLVFHVDAGWNSEIAVSNIESIVKYCNYDLFTYVIDWEEMKDLQLAYFRSGIANQDVPQDHAFFAILYHYAVSNNINYIISGGNTSTEAIPPPLSWENSAMDAVNLKSIHDKYGLVKLNNYRTINLFQYYFYYPMIKKMKTLRPLNFMPYNREEAIKELVDKIGFKEYGRKHGESVFTRFFQNYYLPTKFGFDKRKPHYSSLILTGQITRDEALSMIKEPFYHSEFQLKTDIEFFCRKLGITREEFDTLMASPNKKYTDYPSWDNYYNKVKKIQRFFESLLGKKIRNYS
ncbi:MAG: N-acetyl sugar amidotransferase [Bacteroidota bacterium]